MHLVDDTLLYHCLKLFLRYLHAAQSGEATFFFRTIAISLLVASVESPIFTTHKRVLVMLYVHVLKHKWYDDIATSYTGLPDIPKIAKYTCMYTAELYYILCI